MMEFSAKQQAVLRHSQTDLTSLLVGGAVRSGKSWSIGLSFALWIARQNEPCDAAIVGQSIETIMRNVGFDLLTMLQGMGLRAHLDRQVGTRIVVGPVNVWLIGANDAKARKRIQGSTLKGLVVEELTLLPRDFFWMAWSRLSVDGSKMWASYNPEGPSHWAKREVVDLPDSFDAAVLLFFMRDNPTLSEKVIARYEASFTGHFRKRLIEGQWAAAQGACYPEWHTTTENEVPGGAWHLALDWAVSGTLAALAISAKGKKAVVSDELYHVGRTDGLMNEVEVGDRIAAWWRHGPAFLWCDPATPATFKRILRRHGFIVRQADNAVIPGIVTSAARLATGDVLVHTRCRKLAVELNGYVWDDVAADVGEDKPLKKADHGCDAFRYWAHSTGKAYRHMAATSVKEALQ